MQWRLFGRSRPLLQRYSSSLSGKSVAPSSVLTIPLVESPPSILNDVLGPVMRGPSSSHSAAALRIGRLARDLVGGDVKRCLAEYDPNGSLVSTHDGQGSDMGLAGGLLGFEPDDPRLINYKQELKKAEIETQVSYVSYNASHPNNYKLTLWGADTSSGTHHRMQAISTGGGMMTVTELEGIPVNIGGDYYETIAFIRTGAGARSLADNMIASILLNLDKITAASPPSSPSSPSSPEEEEDKQHPHHLDAVFACTQPPRVAEQLPASALVEIKSSCALSQEALHWLENHEGVVAVRTFAPVLPVLSRRGIALPFSSATSLLSFATRTTQGIPLWRCAALYEAARGNLSEAEVMSRVLQITRVMRAAVETGLAGTEYADRILPCQSRKLLSAMKGGNVIGGDAINTIIAYVSAVMETKSSMGVIVAAPTAGSCGTIPGAVLGMVDFLNKSEEEAVQAMLVAGIVGVFSTQGATFSAEVGGCMAETGSAASMAAAALVSLAGGTNEQALAAASMALQNSFGLACDPVANRVEVPCLGKNVQAASQALSCANMALAGYDAVIPLDEVIGAMDRVGHQIHSDLRCTGRGGVAATRTAREIACRLGDTSADRMALHSKIAC